MEESHTSQDYNPITPPETPVTTTLKTSPDTYKIRNIIGFWILGMTNNYGYVVMLSAAHDILKSQEGNNTSFLTTVEPVTATPDHTWMPVKNFTASPHKNRTLNCNHYGTGIILLADILPSLLCKILAPFFIQSLPYWLKVSLSTLLALAGLITVAISNSVGVSILGVICASLSSGLGEITFLSLTSFFDKSSVSAWSSGTGGAGVLGALSYAGLTMIMSPSNTLFVLCVVPVLLFISYFFIIKRPVTMLYSREVPSSAESDKDIEPLLNPSHINVTQEIPDFATKRRITYALLPLMIALSLVYIFEYTINQAFFELVYFENTFLSHDEQYRWFQVDYQVGVFVSRSSVSLFHFRHVWITGILQGLNVGMFLAQILNPFMPSLWIMLALIFYEGLLGGLAYVNTFYRITKESEPRYKEFSMTVGSMSDTLGIAVAGFISVPIHDAICNMFS